MEKLKELIDLCKQRQQIFMPDHFETTCLFNGYDFDEKYQDITRRIKRLAKTLGIFHLREDGHEIVIGFESLVDLRKITGEEELTQKQYFEETDVYYSITLFEGYLTLFCYERNEEHKKAQAI